MRRRTKYGAVRCEVDGKKFASKRERDYYLQLKRRQLAGEFDRFTCQQPFELLPALYENDVPVLCVNGCWRLEISQGTRRGKCLARSMKYVADFVVWHLDGTVEVVDVKGYKTQSYRAKKRMMRQIHGIEIVEV